MFCSMLSDAEAKLPTSILAFENSELALLLPEQQFSPQQR